MNAATRRELGVPVAVFFVAVAVYAGALRNGFALDDKLQIERNPLIASLAHVPELLRSDYWEPALQRGLYRPAATISYALNYAVGGLDPTSYHAANVLLHALNCVAVWWLLRLLGWRRPVAGASAALFAVHAVHSEAVASISMGRPELLSALFVLCALILHRFGSRSSGPRALLLGGAGMLAYGLALASKESGITFLGLVWLLDGGVLEPGRGERRLLRLPGPRFAGYLAVTALYGLARWLALRDGVLVPPSLPLDNPLVALDVPWRWLNALQVAGRYLALLVAPVALSYDYSLDQIPLIESAGDPRTVLVVAGALLALGVGLRLRRVPEIFGGLLFALVSFSVAANVLWPIGTILGERLVYLPSVGFCAAAVGAVWRLGARLPLPAAGRRALGFGVLAVVLALHAGRAAHRTGDWASREGLYLRDVETVPWSAKAQNNAGFALSRTGRLSAARDHYEIAIGILPEGYAMPYANLGATWIREEPGNPRLGVALLERALEIQPDEPAFLAKLASGYRRLGRLDAARARLERALEIEPTGPAAERRRRALRALGPGGPPGAPRDAPSGRVPPAAQPTSVR